MNWGFLIQLMRRPACDAATADLSLRALKQLLIRSRQRRARALSARTSAEPLEVRQVLSAVSPDLTSSGLLADTDPGVSAAPFFSETVSSQHTDLEAGVICSFRVRFEESLEATRTSSAESQETMFLGMAVSAGHQGRTSVAVTEGEFGAELSVADVIVDWAVDPETSQPPANDSEISISVVLEWTEGPERVEVVGLSSREFQVTLSGLMGGALSVVDPEQVEQTLYRSAAEVLQRVQPGRNLRVSFVARMPVVESAAERLPEAGSPAGSAGQSAAKPEKQSGKSGEVSASVVVGGDTGFGELRDELDARAFDFLFAEVSRELQGGVLDSQLFPTPAESRAGSREASGSSPETPELQQLAPSESAYQRFFAEDGLRGIGRDTLWRGSAFQNIDGEEETPPAFSFGLASHRALFGWQSGKVHRGRRDTVVREPRVDWLGWFIEVTSGGTALRQDSVRGDLLHSYSLPDAVPVLTTETASPSLKGSGAPGDGQPSRKHREYQRQPAVVAGPLHLSGSGHAEFRFPESGSVPRELRYVANPRGPPLYGRDADVPLADGNAPADLLERLRYSIAPRGPSLVTVEMQSPEFWFSSGPRRSSAGWRFSAA